MEIELRYFDGCPNWKTTETRVLRLLDELGISATVRLTRVETFEAAERLGFRGSPTLLLDGTDPFTDPSSPIGLSCRIYRTEAGLAGSPSEAQLRLVLAAAR